MADATPTNDNEQFQHAKQHALMDADQKNTAMYDRLLGRVNTSTSAPQEAAAHPTTENDGKKLKHVTPHGDSEAFPADAFLQMVLSDVDYRPKGVSPRDLREGLDAFRGQFKAMIDASQSPTELYKNLAAFIAEEHMHLFYETNDYMTTCIRKDYVKHFLDALCVEMHQSQLLDSDTLDRFEDLEAMYDMGTEAYGELNRQMDYATEGQTNSLLFKANTAREEAIKKGDQNPLALKDFAHEAMWDLLEENHDIEPFADIPSPYLILLAKESSILARSALRTTYPHLNFQDPELCRDQRYYDQFEDILETWKDRIAKNPSIDSCYNVYLDLKKRIKAADRLPDNFDELVEKAHKAAGTAAGKDVVGSLQDDKWMTQTPAPKTRKMVEALQPSFTTPAYLDNCVAWYLRRMDSLLCGDSSKEELLEQLEEGLDLLADRITLYGLHPATALAAETYIATFRKSLGQSLHKAGCDDIPFLARLKELETKASLIHENQRVLGQWLMEGTLGGHDNFFHQVFMTIGSDHLPMQAEDLQKIADYISGCLAEAAEEHGIPPALSGVQYIPLVYARCQDIAEAEMSRQQGREVHGSIYADDASESKPQRKSVAELIAQRPIHETWVTHINGAPIDVEGGVLTPEEKTLRNKVIRKRTMDLFHQAIARLVPPEFVTTVPLEEELSPEDEPQTAETEGAEEALSELPQYPIELTAHNLRLVFEFLDQIDRHHSPTLLH